MSAEYIWQGKLFSSLRFKKEILDAVYQKVVSFNSELVRFLQNYNFEAHVSCALSWPVISNVGIDMRSVKKELENFLVKAENFKNEHNEYSVWWPDLDRGEVMRLTYSNILSGHSDPYACFALIVSTVMEAIDIIEIWEKPRGIMT